VDHVTTDDSAPRAAPGAAPASSLTGESGFVVDLPHYSGPLDLLLALIRDEKVDIYDIPVAKICQQFILRMHQLKLDEAADYLEMAARLLRIKAQMLLPRPESEDAWEDPRAELVRRLLEYQQMREVVDVLERLGEDRRNRFARTFVPASLVPVVQAPLSLSLGELLAAVDRVLRHAQQPQVHDVISRPIDVDGFIDVVRAVIALRAVARFRDVVPLGAERWEVLSGLLALLELARRGELRLTQLRPFASVEIRREFAGEAA
jgi:segregation and condensation protein A